MKTKIILQATLCAAVLGLAASASAQVPIGSPGLGLGSISAIPGADALELIATGTGNVSISSTFVSTSAGDDDQLFLYDVKGGTYTLAGSYQLNGNGPDIFDNKTPSEIGTTVDLGSFAAGDELVFELKDISSGKDWFSGSDTSMNTDGKDHFDVSSVSGNTVTVGVEDATDFDYNDLVYSFSGVSTQTVPDAAGTMSLLGLGLTGLTAFGRRFRK